MRGAVPGGVIGYAVSVSDPGRAQMWQVARGRRWTLDRPRVLGILNVTPDSFYDGGSHARVDDAVRAGVAMLDEGADGLDVGGESTRPGAAAVAADEQVERVEPVIRGLRKRVGDDPVITIDTRSASVARAALDAGATGVNDVSGGMDDPEMLGLAARRGCGVVLMHRLREPWRDSYSDEYGQEDRPRYDDVVREVGIALERLASRAMAAGVARESIVLDPGLGFGKTVEQNLELIRRTGELAGLGYPILSGLSRKSFVGRAMTPEGEKPPAPEGRLAGTLWLSVLHVRLGARVLRVHDVGAHVAALEAARADGLIG